MDTYFIYICTITCSNSNNLKVICLFIGEVGDWRNYFSEEKGLLMDSWINEKFTGISFTYGDKKYSKFQSKFVLKY